ncbi:alpha-mannosidase [Terriglobus saanensis]|uniref:Alpha-mannosidase n=1 Tax=Terriglobus saanensis (strain ATCC BAA-1853 / DSM 23119 / SP1PR4) TaxID=401053 RepID=E8V2L4_TERSS|nr:glycoside hydrolase family 38 C-terminal domain-containing protein [Terriglobus saanensis]ADV83489.1 Alpha-mannosidase [Terriglobus saanensis SP1PR4]
MLLKSFARRPLFKQCNRLLFVSCLALPIFSAPLFAQQGPINKAPDITTVPTLYVVPYAHLDTQWRWEMPQTISEYLLKTLKVNFDYIDKYPHYVFNWTGSNRYRLMKEYFPDDYARMMKYVAAGRWFPAGSSVEEGDVNLPSAEAIFRQVLYGNDYYRKDFGKYSNEYMIPDCFGFPASLPAILAHAGVKGFSTQKLNAEWQPAPKIGGPGSPEQTPEGIPFNVGLWIGPDGTKVIAALNPSGYGSNVYTDLSKENPPVPMPVVSAEEMATLTTQQKSMLTRNRTRNNEPNWVKRIDLDGKVTGVYADYHYVGTGDIGGATQEFSVKLLEAIATKSETTLPPPPRPNFLKPTPPSTEMVRVGEGPVHVIETEADQMFNDIKPDMMAKMPSYQGDLELINHSAGSLTSQAYHKRWVVKNELLAEAAEETSVAAALMGGRAYPQKRMNDAWTLALGGHFHDTAAGTATPRSYEFAWNDDIIVANQFAGVLTSATEAVASGMNTQGAGTPLVVFNSLNIDREDLVEAKVPFAGAAPRAVHVKGPNGEDVPAQMQDGKVLFVAKAPSVGFAVYDVSAASAPAPSSALKVTANSLENPRYKVALNADGDVSSVFDKKLNKELLSAPIRMAFSNDTPKQWPAWNMDFDQEQAAPVGYVSGPAKIRIKENGPVRVSIEVARDSMGSKFVQTISLSAGDAGNRVEFANVIDWRSKKVNLKVAFPLSASNPNATYNEEVGTIQRPNATDRQFETFSHRWIDLTDASGSFGATILTEAKNASDKPSDNTIRLTLLRTPGLQPTANGSPAAYADQANQDWGHHEFSFGLIGHAAGWREAQTDWQGYRLNDPLRAFSTTKHAGTLGKSFSLVQVSNPRVRILALKKAEGSDETIVRLVELDGKPAQDVRVSFTAPVGAAREVNGQEQPLGEARIDGGALVTSFVGYQPRTFALKLGAAKATVPAVTSQSVDLKYDLATASNDDTKTTGEGMDGKGNAFPAEMLSSQLSFHGVDFKLAAPATGTPNAVVANGQTIQLPAGKFNRVYLLAASVGGDQETEFRVGSSATKVTVQDWGGFIGQWDTRLWKNEDHRDWAISAHHPEWPGDFKAREASPAALHYPEDYVGLREGYVKPAEVAWYVSHHHTADGLNVPYQYSYLFAYAMDVPANAKTLTLPKNDKVRILAVSVANENPTVIPAQPLADTLRHTTQPTSQEPAQ